MAVLVKKKKEKGKKPEAEGAAKHRRSYVRPKARKRKRVRGKAGTYLN